MPGPLIILSGPAGSGKTTLVERLLTEGGLRLRRAVTATTRLPRAGECDGTHYHFWTPERFAAAIQNDELLEWAPVHGQNYGTPRSEVAPYCADEWAVLLVIDVQGARQVRQKCPDAVSLFLKAPAWEDYEQRLRDRGSEDVTSIARRLASARRELDAIGEYDHVVVNDNLAVAAAEVRDRIAERFNKRRPL